jgi:hypothetical protein
MIALRVAHSRVILNLGYSQMIDNVLSVEEFIDELLYIPDAMLSTGTVNVICQSRGCNSS